MENIIYKLENELVYLTTIVIKCITDYYNTGNKDDISEVDDWNNRLLNNLKKYKVELDDAILEYKNGDSQPLQGITSMIGSIERNVDNFSSDWMAIKDKNIFEKTLNTVSNISYEISVALYEP